MKKTLFSLAFLAASGGYVVYANHDPESLLSGIAGPVDAETAALPGPGPLPSENPAVVDAGPAATITAAPPAPLSPQTSAIAAAPAFVASVAAAAAATPIPTGPTPAPAAPAPVVPPLPRHRPLAAPAIVSAQAVTVSPNGSAYRDGTYTGSDANAYYGRVQVRVSVVNNRIVSVTPIDYPSDRRTSRYINSVALPLLQQEVISAQDANIDTISGATLTSEAYIKSLGNALHKALGGNA